MSTLSLRLPASLHRTLRELSERDDVSINQFIATAVAEKTAALLTVEYLEARGRQSSRALFDQVLARVPDIPPGAGDELPKTWRSSASRVCVFRESANAVLPNPTPMPRACRIV